MYLQPGHAGRVITMVFFNGALIRTLGTEACLTPVANNGHLLAKLTSRLLTLMSINHRLKFASKTNHAGYGAKQTGSQHPLQVSQQKRDINSNVRIVLPD